MFLRSRTEETSRILIRSHVDNLPRVEDEVRIQRALEGAQQLQLRGCARIGQIVLLQQTNAVLGRDAAAVFSYQGEDVVVSLLGVRKKFRLVHAVRLHHVDVQVAV